MLEAAEVFTDGELSRVLAEWTDRVGVRPRVMDPLPGRELWPIIATDGTGHHLKRLGPWRNLPVLDEARVLTHLAAHGVVVAPFEPTDTGRVFAGLPEDSFVLMPTVAGHPAPADPGPHQGMIGGAVARLHRALAFYPASANSYREEIAANLAASLDLPMDLAGSFDQVLPHLTATLADLPEQLVHGDLTPGNVLVDLDASSVSFIDFDHLPTAPRVWDLGKLLGRQVRRPSPAEALPTITGFLAGYHDLAELSIEEVIAIPAAMLSMNAFEISHLTRVAAGDLPRRWLPEDTTDLAGAIEAFRWHLRHLDAVTAAAMAGRHRPGGNR